MLDGKMHQTTIRLSPDLWEALEQECAQLGVSVAQYLREAALARLAYTAGRRGETGYGSGPLGATAGRSTPPAERVASASATAEDQMLDASAVQAQSVLARARAQALRDRAASLRRHHLPVGSGAKSEHSDP